MEGLRRKTRAIEGASNPEQMLGLYAQQRSQELREEILRLWTEHRVEYARQVETPQVFFFPAIDPFSIKNRQLTEEEKQARLDYYDIPTDLPLVTQVSRFDYWKDPEGVIQAFKLAREQVDAFVAAVDDLVARYPEARDVEKSRLL